MKPSNQTLRSLVISTALVCAILLQYCEAGSRSRSSRSRSSSRRQSKHKDPVESRRDRKPNIILVMSDDQDVLLGSMSAMNKTKRLLGEKGANFVNAFVTTPLCCPSRSSILTGQYVHNHRVYSNQDHCVSPEWKAGPERRSFGAFLQNANYRTGYFGKYLNRYDGSYVPEGWMEWVGLIQNSKFYNYTLNRNGQLFNHGHDYHRDYLPDLIANDSMTFFKLSKMAYPDNPIHMVLSFPGPHGPEDGAPQYAHMFQGNQMHRTPSWNHSPNHDKHWIMQYTSALSEQHKIFTDYLQRKRLITLMSIDDAIEKLCNTLDELGELDNTYIIYTSDHGYHLGQYGMVKGKSNPYDFDIRVPFFIRGPKVPHGIQVPNIALNIDLAPTMLSLAGIPIPPYMDGTSLMKLFDPPGNYRLNKRRRYRYVGREPWRDSFLIERTRSPEEWEHYFRRIQKEHGTPGPKKQSRIEDECSLPEMQAPCEPEQTHFCDIEESTGAARIRKCREVREREREREPKCKCTKIRTGRKNSETKGNKRGSTMTKAEKRQQRVFLREHTIQEDNQRHRFLRGRRDVAQEVQDLSDFEGSYDLQFELSQLSAIVGDTKCKVLTNDTVVCDEEVFSSKKTIVQHKKRIDEQLRLLREQMKNLQEIKLYLKRSQPDKDNLKSATKETHICTCEGGLSYTTNEEFLADGPGVQETVIEAVNFEDDIELEENGRDRDRKDKKKKSDRRRNRQKRRATFDDGFTNDAEPFFQENLTGEEGPLYDSRDAKETQTLSMLERRRLRKQEKKKSKSKKECSLTGMNCFSHDNDHWRTAPYWTLGNICVCSNTVNNSYSCVRTINETHNLLYCEFITKFLEYYDMRPEVDPHQTINGIYNLSDGERRHLTNQVHHLKNCSGYSDCTEELSPHYIAIGHEGYGMDGMVNPMSGSGSGENGGYFDKADDSFTMTTDLDNDQRETSSLDLLINGSGDGDEYQINVGINEDIESLSDLFISTGSGSGYGNQETDLGQRSFIDTFISGSGNGYDNQGSGQRSLIDVLISGSGSNNNYQEFGSGELQDILYETELGFVSSGNDGKETAKSLKDRDLEPTAIPLPSLQATSVPEVQKAFTSEQSSLSRPSSSENVMMKTHPSGQSSSVRNTERTLPAEITMSSISLEQIKEQGLQVLLNNDDILTTASSDFTKISTFSTTATNLGSQVNPEEIISIHDDMNIHEDVNIHEDDSNISTKFEWVVANGNAKVTSSDLSLILVDGFLLDMSAFGKTTHNDDDGIDFIKLLRKLSKRISKKIKTESAESSSELTTPKTSTQHINRGSLTRIFPWSLPDRTTRKLIQETLYPHSTPTNSPNLITTPPPMVTTTKDIVDNHIDSVLVATKQSQSPSSFPALARTDSYHDMTNSLQEDESNGYGNLQSNDIEVTDSSKVKGQLISLNAIDYNFVHSTVKSDDLSTITTQHSHAENEKDIQSSRKFRKLPFKNDVENIQEHSIPSAVVNEESGQRSNKSDSSDIAPQNDKEKNESQKDTEISRKFRKPKMRKVAMNFQAHSAVIIEGSGLDVSGQRSNDSSTVVTMDTDFTVDQIIPV